MPNGLPGGEADPMTAFNAFRTDHPLHPFETAEDRWLCQFFFQHGISQGALKVLIVKMKGGFDWHSVTYDNYKGMKKILEKVPIQVCVVTKERRKNRPNTSLCLLQIMEKVDLAQEFQAYNGQLILMKKNVSCTLVRENENDQRTPFSSRPGWPRKRCCGIPATKGSGISSFTKSRSMPKGCTGSSTGVCGSKSTKYVYFIMTEKTDQINSDCNDRKTSGGRTLVERLSR